MFDAKKEKKSGQKRKREKVILLNHSPQLSIKPKPYDSLSQSNILSQ